MWLNAEPTKDWWQENHNRTLRWGPTCDLELGRRESEKGLDFDSERKYGLFRRAYNNIANTKAIATTLVALDGVGLGMSEWSE